MRRAEQIAWSALAGLLVILGILVAGGFAYQFTAFWAGAMLVGGQALVVALAAWGLMLARQSRELGEVPAAPSGFRMGASDDAPQGAGFGEGSGLSKTLGDLHVSEPAARTLDIGFQRLLVASAGVVMTALGVWAAWLLFAAYRWSGQNPGEVLAVAGPYTPPEGVKPLWLNELALFIGLAAAFIYGVLYWVTRPRRDAEGFGEATGGTFTLGITAMVALGVATVLGYFRVSWASEIAAGVIACFLLLQGLELIVNSLRNYSSIEELDQEAVDLQATPVAPMLGSIWLSGLRLLFAQSVGLSEGKKQERGVIARMMPRTLAAIVLIAIGASCVRVVQPGTVAVLERLGRAATDGKGELADAAMLQPGLHFTLPWPIDELVVIPTEQLQLSNVGTELHARKEWKGIDFQFWKFRGDEKASAAEDLFLTGDTGSPQMLETFVQVRWRVTDAKAFYRTLSHSDFVEKTTEEAKKLPIYVAIVKQCTSFAVTQAFAIHTLEQVMIDDRREVETHCRDILQQKLDSLGNAVGERSSGITVDYLTIKDLHPPLWRQDRYDPTEPRVGGIVTFVTNKDGKKELKIEANQNQNNVSRGPASAFEFVVSMREFHETIIDLSRAEATAEVAAAQGFADSTKKLAESYALDRVARAHGEADRLVEMTKDMDVTQQKYQLQLMKQQLLYASLRDLWDPVTKIVVDPAVKDIEIYQATDKGMAPITR